MAFFTVTYGHFSNWILERLGLSLLRCSLPLIKRRCIHAVSVSVRHLLIVVSTSDDEVSLTHFSPPSFHFPGLPPSPQQLKAPGGVCRGGVLGGCEAEWVLVLTQLPWLFQLSDSDRVTSLLPASISALSAFSLPFTTSIYLLSFLSKICQCIFSLCGNVHDNAITHTVLHSFIHHLICPPLSPLHIYNDTVLFWLRVIQFHRSILAYMFSSSPPHISISAALRREAASVAAPPASPSGREEVLTSSHLLLVLHDPSPLLHPLTHISTYLRSRCKHTTGFNVQRLGWGAAGVSLFK